MDPILKLAESMAQPGLMGPLGMRLEKRCLNGMAAYFRALSAQVRQAGLGRLAEMPAPQAAHVADMVMHGILRRARPVLRATIEADLRDGFNLAAGLPVYVGPQEADRPAVQRKIEWPDQVGTSGQDAADWAAEHAGELVVGLDRTSADLIKTAVSDGIEQRLGPDGVTRAIDEVLGFFERDRASTIARTEMNDSMQEAYARKMAQDGSEAKQLVLEPDACPICELNAEADPLPLDAAYPSGDQRPPFHPNCRCSLASARPAGDFAKAIDQLVGDLLG